MLKKILIGVVVLVILAGGGAYFLYSNLGVILKAAIEKYGTEATQAPVSVSSVTLSPTDGAGSIAKLTIGNPPGFTSPKSFEMGELKLAVDIRTLTANPVAIRDVTILAPQITYERGQRGGNLEVIRDNVQKYAATPEGSKPPPSSGSSGSSPAPTKSEQPEKKVIIENLYVRDAKIIITAPGLPALGTRTLDATLPTIHLKDIGKDKGGATPAEVASQVLGAIANEASKVAVASLQRSLGNIGGAAQEQLQRLAPGGTGGTGETTGSGAGGGVGERLRGVLGR
jgi:hypothetical protein